VDRGYGGGCGGVGVGSSGSGSGSGSSSIAGVSTIELITNNHTKDRANTALYLLIFVFFIRDNYLKFVNDTRIQVSSNSLKTKINLYYIYIIQFLHHIEQSAILLQDQLVNAIWENNSPLLYGTLYGTHKYNLSVLQHVSAHHTCHQGVFVVVTTRRSNGPLSDK
jgi:hypothetical protein